jgi:uncharacterized protein (TIGR02594 family)
MRYAEDEERRGVREVRGTAGHNPRILEYFRTTPFQGNDNDEAAWCSAFANWCVLQAGMRGTGRANARSWLNWGEALSEPRPGAITVFRRGTSAWQGHVAFYVGPASTAGNIEVLGGNQANQVCRRPYATDRLLGYRWPSGSPTRTSSSSSPTAYA